MASKGKKVSSTTQSLPIVTDPEMAERFERELNWCCQQLESMIRVSSSSKEKEPRKFFRKLKISLFKFSRFSLSSIGVENIVESESFVCSKTSNDATIIR